MTRLNAALTALLALAACATNPVTGKRELSLVSESQEIQLGKESAEQVKATMPVLKDPKVQAYVESIGKRIAAQSERPNVPWQFTVLDDATVNAFALPGGPVFITRGILTHMNSEAELVSVMGHEIGHITARHSVEQMSKAQLAQLGLGLGMILKPELAGLGQAAGAGLQLLFLKYGRDAERQADELGFKYLVKQNYDPRPMKDMFVTLKRSSELAGAGRMPEWASTHPDPENRAETAQKRADDVAKTRDLNQLKVGRDEFLAIVNGMTFGDDPRQGYFKGSAFYHPELKFQVQLPDGWPAQNTASALVAVSPSQDAALQLGGAGNTPPDQAMTKFFSQQGVQRAANPVGALGPLPTAASYFQAQTEQGAVAGLVAFVSHGGATYQLVGYTAASKLGSYDPAFKKAMASFGPLTDPQAAAVQPAKLELVKVPRDMKVSEFVAQFPSTAPPEQVALVNGVDKDGVLKAGTNAKRIVGGTPGIDATVNEAAKKMSKKQ